MSARDVEWDAGDGLRLHVRVAGEGPPVVLLHGFTGSAETWAFAREALEARHTTVAVDLPGHGSSNTPPDPARYALPRFADDLARLLDGFALERVALLGYSMGGRAALHFAVRHPGRVAALVLESASPGIASEEERARRIAADAALAELIEREGVAAFVDRWEALPLWESQSGLPAPVRAALRAQRLRNSTRGLANSLRGAGAGAEPSLERRLGEIAAPTLLVAGSLDAKYASLGRAMERGIPGARLEVVEGAGHAVHIERPDAFIEIVSRFLGA